jgi:hypothetical protein
MFWDMLGAQTQNMSLWKSSLVFSYMPVLLVWGLGIPVRDSRDLGIQYLCKWFTLFSLNFFLMDTTAIFVRCSHFSPPLHFIHNISSYLTLTLSTWNIRKWKVVSVLQTCYWCSRWNTYQVYTASAQPGSILQLKGFPVAKLSHGMFIQFSICLCPQWLGRGCSGSCHISQCPSSWLLHPRW